MTFEDFLKSDISKDEIQITGLGINTPNIVIGPQRPGDSFRRFLHYLVDLVGIESVIETNTLFYKEGGYARATKKDDEITRRFHLEENTVPLMIKFSKCIEKLVSAEKLPKDSMTKFEYDFDDSLKANILKGTLNANADAENKNSQAVKLKREDLTEDIVVIKINKLYREGLSELELYEVTRGMWKRKIESVSPCEYCLSVANSNVVEVYKISAWYPAGTIPMQTRELDSDKIKGRIEFVGEVAEANIRNKYLGKSVADLYKMGEADPVKVFLKGASDVKPITDINIAASPIMVITTDEIPIVICPNCENEFSMAPRCPECGQLIAYKKDRWNKPKLKSLQEWADAASITGAKPKEVTDFVEKAILDSRIHYHMGAVDMSLDYEDVTTNKVLKMLLLFGKERCGAIQPSSFYDFVEKTGLNEEAVDQFLSDILPFLSTEQKNKPYNRLNGYYFIDYFTIVGMQEELLSVFKTLLDNL